MFYSIKSRAVGRSEIGGGGGGRGEGRGAEPKTGHVIYVQSLTTVKTGKQAPPKASTP